MSHENTNWSQSVAGVCIKDGCVLLARHTYGSGKGKLIIPGGYVEIGEAPQAAVAREYMEETGVAVEAREIIGIRFNARDWYVVFSVEYISGEPRSDCDENSEVLWVDISEALEREDVPALTKSMIRQALKEKPFKRLAYEGKHEPNSLYGVE